MMCNQGHQVRAVLPVLVTLIGVTYFRYFFLSLEGISLRMLGM
jgi:hypothetical protein